MNSSIGLYASSPQDDDIIFQPLHKKCQSIKNELTHPNLKITYSKRPRRHLMPKIWLLRWQKVYIPIPQLKYTTLILFNYHKSVRKFARAPGFILLAKDGTAVVAMHYFKTLKYVYTNGIDFALNLPQELRSHAIFKNLHIPEISTSMQSKMFSYIPSSLHCTSLNKYKRTIMTALLMVKIDYSFGTLISAYKSMGGHTGWVSKEKISLKQNSENSNYWLWKGFYTRLFAKSVMNHVRIYSPANHDIKNLALTLGYFNKAGYKNRPEWLYQFEKLLYRNSAINRSQFLSAIKQAHFDKLSLNSAAN